MANDDDERLAALLLKWEESWDLGEEIPLADLCADHPELEQNLANQIRLLKSMNWMKQNAADDIAGHSDEDDSFIGELLAGRYRIDSIIGFGGHGKVYKAFDPELQRHVAVKVSKPIASETQTDELLEEARRAAKLKHPHIVAVHDVGRHDGQLFFVTELVEGQNLADLIARGRVKSSEAKRIVSALADALQFAHDQGFLHRDIKPANILLDHQGHVLVTDFGIATTIDKVENHRGGTPGTLPYMAPEQIAGQVQLIDSRTDIHALGVVLYELLAGELPYQGRTPTAVREQILFRQANPLSSLNQSVPKQLEAICLKCLAKHPADRYRTAREVKQALGASASTRVTKFGLVIVGLALIALTLLAWRPWAQIQNTEQTKVPAPVVKDNVFVFDGASRIVTPLKRFSPATMEAWVKLRHTDTGCYFIVGSDVRTKFGIGFGVCGSTLSAETIPKLIRSEAIVEPGKWVHLAAVFGGDETRLYLDGKLVKTAQPTRQVNPESVFVIGNVGLKNSINFFEGEMRSVRISEGERYVESFTPDGTFPPDEQARLIYDGKHLNGTQIEDISGHGNEGTWESVIN